MKFAEKITQAVEAVCPIHGISFGKTTDKNTWRIDFKPEATKEQRDAAQAKLRAIEPTVVMGQMQAADAIERLEASQTPRRVREAVLGTDNGWLAALEAKIKSLRG